MENMKKERLAYFRELLNERLKVLLNEADKTVTGMTNDKSTFPDPTDRANMETDRNFELRIRDRERKLILKIKEALARIEDGTFGTCEECGQVISKARSEAVPWARHCKDCKERLDSRT